MRENPDCEKYGLWGIWNNMTGEANHRENPITESLGSWPLPVPSSSSPTPGELSRCRLCDDCPEESETSFSLSIVLLPGDPQSEALAASAAEPTRRTMVSSQRQNNARTSETTGQGKEGRTGNTTGCRCAIPANQTQIQMQAAREHLKVYISAGFHSWTVMTSHAKLISPGYSSGEG